MANPLFMQLLKGYMPQIIAQIGSLEKEIIVYLSNVQLREGETHCTAFFEIDNDEQTVYIVIGAFCDKLFVRTVEVKPLSDFLKEMITKFF
jgi:hypothetical protein